jgi:hypothetical protein
MFFLLQVVLLSSQNGNGAMTALPEEAIAYFSDSGAREEHGQNGAEDGAYRSHLVRQMKDWLTEQVWEVGRCRCPHFLVGLEGCMVCHMSGA